jgi:aminoglycoside 6'-N-acetyltransferase
VRRCGRVDCMIRFDTLTPAHLPLLHGWLQQPHVRAYWDDGERTPEAVAAHYFAPEHLQEVSSFVFWLAGRPAGYLQTYPVGPGDEFAAYRHPDGRTWGLDLLIGEAALTGQGYGPAVLGAFMAYWSGHRPVRRYLLDPDSRNARAVRAFERAGFALLGQHAEFFILACDPPYSMR